MHTLLTAIIQSMWFKGIDPESATDVTSNLGVTWFKSDGIMYTVSIQTVEYELDEQEPPNPF